MKEGKGSNREVWGTARIDRDLEGSAIAIRVYIGRSRCHLIRFDGSDLSLAPWMFVSTAIPILSSSILQSVCLSV